MPIYRYIDIFWVYKETVFILYLNNVLVEVYLRLLRGICQIKKYVDSSFSSIELKRRDWLLIDEFFYIWAIVAELIVKKGGGSREESLGFVDGEHWADKGCNDGEE